MFVCGMCLNTFLQPSTTLYLFKPIVNDLLENLFFIKKYFTKNIRYNYG